MAPDGGWIREDSAASEPDTGQSSSSPSAGTPSTILCLSLDPDPLIRAYTDDELNDLGHLPKRVTNPGARWSGSMAINPDANRIDLPQYSLLTQASEDPACSGRRRVGSFHELGTREDRAPEDRVESRISRVGDLEETVLHLLIEPENRLGCDGETPTSDEPGGESARPPLPPLGGPVRTCPRFGRHCPPNLQCGSPRMSMTVQM